MTDPYDERPLPPAPVLLPPTTPSGYYSSPGATPQDWAAPPTPHYPTQYGTPGAAPAAARAGQPAPAYQPHGYDYYGQHAGHPPGQTPPPWGYGGWPPPPPPRTSSTIGRVLLGLVGAAAAMLFALILLGAVVGASDSTASQVDHSPARPDPDGTSELPRGSAAVLAENPLYTQGGLANRNCPAEDLGDASTAEQTAFYQTLMTCLNAEWEPPITSAGYSYTDPGLLAFDAPITTPCGSATPEDGRRLAFYCPGDSVLYADVPQMRNFYGDLDVAYAILIGHEFGHHVQFETGVLAAYEQAVYDDYDQRLILSRRVELQASCMGGLFLGAVAESFPVDDERLALLERVAASFGDSPNAPENRRDHGTGRSNHDWIMRAFSNNDIGECNTFGAPDSEVD